MSLSKIVQGLRLVQSDCPITVCIKYQLLDRRQMLHVFNTFFVPIQHDLLLILKCFLLWIISTCYEDVFDCILTISEI